MERRRSWTTRVLWIVFGALLAGPLLATAWGQDAPGLAVTVPDAAAVTQVVADAAATAPTPFTEEAAKGMFLSQGTANILWLLIAGSLVFFMQAGFAMVETGLTRAKSAVNIMMKNLMDFCFGSLVFWALGYCLMYGGTKGGILGWTPSLLFAGSFGAGQDQTASASWFFQVVFAATAATIVSGAMAERTKLIAYLVYSVMISALIYPISGHWIWGGGWLSQMGFRDFAGSTVVHSVGAWSALAGAILIGPRIGKYNKDGTPNAIPGHNMVIAALGVFILWFGWYGFNPGSTLMAVDGIAHVAVTTTLAAAAGAVAALTVSWFSFGKPDLSMTLNGTLAGLVGITAPCASVNTLSAVIIGLVAGVLVFYSCLFIERVLKIDDPVGAISVHGVCGAWGTLAVGLFGQRAIDLPYWSDTTAIQDGLFYGGGFAQLWPQLVGVLAVFAYAFVSMLIIFGILKATIGLRITAAEELEGVDLAEHDMAAYPDFQQTYIKSYHIREA